MKTTRTARDEALLREAVRAILTPPPAGGLLHPDLLDEAYVVGVLGLRRGLVAEARFGGPAASLILQEHLMFEGFWSTVKDKVLDAVKDNPVTNAVEAAKAFGEGVNGVVVALTGVVNGGGDPISTVVKGARDLMGKRLAAVKKALGRLAARMAELASKASGAAARAIGAVADKVKAFAARLAAEVRGLSEGGGWRGMMGALVVYLAVQAAGPKVEKAVDAALKLLSGDPKTMAKGAAALKSSVDDVVGGDDDEEEPPADAGDDATAGAVAAVWSSVRSLAWGLVKKAVGAAGAEAVEGLAGPVAWIKKLADVFTKVAGGVAWVCEELMAAVRRASFKPLGGGSAAA